jgi:hypothetical protein
MYVPFSSERSAFWLAIGLAALTGVSIAVGIAAVPLAGALVFAGGLVAAAVADVVSRDPNRRLPLSEAAHAPHLHGAAPSERHVLVVANDSLAGTELRDEITLQAGPSQLDILAPVRCSRTHYLLNDYDRETVEARTRLDASLTWAAEQGFEARGEVGDPNPLAAIEDELRDFGADAVIFVHHPADRSTWLESRELGRLRAELDVPVAELPVADSA